MRCSDRAAAELAARQTIRRDTYLQIEVQASLTDDQVAEITDLVTNLAQRYGGPDAQVDWDVTN